MKGLRYKVYWVWRPAAREWFAPLAWRIRLAVEAKQHTSYALTRTYEMRKHSFEDGSIRPRYVRLLAREQRILRLWTALAQRLDVEVAPVFGRYEGESSPTRTAWLDDHSEYAHESTGDTDWGMWVDLFHDTPWGDSALLTSGGLGFRSASFGTRAEMQADYDNIRREYETAMTYDDEASD